MAVACADDSSCVRRKVQASHHFGVGVRPQQCAITCPTRLHVGGSRLLSDMYLLPYGVIKPCRVNPFAHGERHAGHIDSRIAFHHEHARLAFGAPQPADPPSTRLDDRQLACLRANHDPGRRVALALGVLPLL